MIFNEEVSARLLAVRVELEQEIAEAEEQGADVAAVKAYMGAVLDYATYVETVDLERLLAEADPALREFVLRTLAILYHSGIALGSVDQ